MGTPLNSLQKLLSPRLAQPFLSNGSKCLNKVPIIRNKNIAKRLDFSTHKKEKHTSPINETNVSVTISDYAKKNIENLNFFESTNTHLLINTPNKIELQKCGLQPFKNILIVGKGTFGTVVKGIFKGKPVALKIIKNQINIRERNALQLEHENIVNIIDIIEDKNEKFAIIIMENEESSQNLQKLIDNQSYKLPFERRLNIALDTCLGIAFCHKKGILHLDLKPGNILINYSGKAKICDFGNSHKIGSETKLNHYGTIIYTAPEILRGQPPTTLCDIYSLGIIFWQLETLTNPFEELLCKEIVIYKVVKYHQRPKLPKHFVDLQYGYLYSRCWHKNPIERPQISTVILILNDIIRIKYVV